MRVKMLALLTAMAFGLAGCFLSTEPVITAETADFPFYRITYDAYPFDRFVYGEDGMITTDTIEQRGDTYGLVGASGVRLLLQDFGDNLFVGQLYLPAEGGQPAVYVYGAAVIDRDAMQIRLYRIQSQPGDYGPGLEECAEGGDACVTSVSALAALAAADIAADARPTATLRIHAIR